MLGEKIKKYREEKKMTQMEVAEVLGVKPATISKYEAGALEPNIESLKKLAELFVISVDELLKEDKFDAQLEFLINIYSEMINKNISNKRYKTNFVNIINSLQLANENLERIKECYEEALNEHYRKFMKNYEHIYENYLVYYMFKILFPCNE